MWEKYRNAKETFFFLRGEVARDLAYPKSKGETVISLVRLFFNCFVSITKILINLFISLLSSESSLLEIMLMHKDGSHIPRLELKTKQCPNCRPFSSSTQGHFVLMPSPCCEILCFLPARTQSQKALSHFSC